MSQDMKRDREMDRKQPRVEEVAQPSASMQRWIDDANTGRWQDIAYNENERAGRLQVALDAANTKLAEANDALEQARRDAAGDARIARIKDYLDCLEQNADEDDEAALTRDSAIHAADSLFSQFQAANRARASRKVIKGLRDLLNEDAIVPMADWEIELLKTRYWHLDNGFAGVGEYYKAISDGRLMFWYARDAQWLESSRFKNVFYLATDERSREIAATPEDVTP